MSESAILVRGLRARLGGKEVLHGVDLDVRPGALYGLLGRNGAGKTTAMRCLLGLLPFARGECRVFGVEAARLHRLARPIGVALDPPGLDDGLTVRQNLELARVRGGLRGGRGVDEVLDLVGLTHRQRHRGDRLSHGQGRRAAVARALLGAPELLVLDEPLSGLDPDGVEQLLALFQRLTREHGVTVVLSSHHLREVEHVCDRVGILEEGGTLLEGEVEALLERAGDRLHVRCRRPARAAEILAAEAGTRSAVDADGDELRVRVDRDFDREAALARLVEGGAGVVEFRRARGSLVDLFRDAVHGAGGASAQEAA